MKAPILALLCAFTVSGAAVADDVETQLKAMEAAKESYSKLNDSSKGFYAENCPKHLTFWQQAAEQGHAIAQSFLGVCYSHGQGIAKDQALAVAWYRKAAEQGYAPAQANLGVMYRDGKGIAKDETQAVEWLLKAAEQGYLPAQINLASIYANSTSSVKDEAEAVKWFTKAAEQGNAPAQANLAIMYRDGKGITKDETQAAAWFNKANQLKEQNNLLAQFKQLCKEYDEQPDEALKTKTYKKSLKVIENINKTGINDWLGTLTKNNADKDNQNTMLTITIGGSSLINRDIDSDSPIYNAARHMQNNEKVIFSGENLAAYSFSERGKVCNPDFEIELTQLSNKTTPEPPKQMAMQASSEQESAKREASAPNAPVAAPVTAEKPASTLPPMQAVKKTATVDAQSCLDIARTGMIGNTQEIICNFKGRLKEKFMTVYNDNDCSKLVSAVELDKLDTEVLKTMKNNYLKMGEKAYCTDAKGYYNGVAKTLNLINAKTGG